MNNPPTRAPIGIILPSFAPVFFERGIPGYEAESLTPGELRVPRGPLRALLMASTFVGAWNHASDRGLDYDKVKELLTQSVSAIPGFSPSDARATLELVNRFLSFSIIREDHALDDWLCEALWPAFQTEPYRYPSAMSGAIFYALTIGDTLRKLELEY